MKANRTIGLLQVPRDGAFSPDEPLSDVLRQTLDGTIAFYDRVGFHPPWVSFLAVAIDDERSLATGFVGTGAFKGPPKEGRVEIAYYTFPGGENRGVATQMALALVEIARTADPAVIVTARTLIEPNASQRVLTKAGFESADVVVDPEDGEVLEWVYEGG